jgi:hypothetical protein
LSYWLSTGGCSFESGGNTTPAKARKPETRRSKPRLRFLIQLDQHPEQSAQQSASGQQTSCLAPVEIAVIPIATTANNINAFSFFMVFLLFLDR